MQQLEPRYPRSSERLAEAKREIDTEIASISSLGGDAATFVYAHQAARKRRWEQQVKESHASYLAALDEQQLRAKSNENVQKADLDRAVERVREAEKNNELAIEELGPGSGEGKRNLQADPGGLLGSPRSELLAWVFVPLAVGADIAAFYTVLALLFRSNPRIIVIGTIGFAAAAVGLAHAIGIAAKRRKLRMPQSSTGLYWAGLLSWVALGGVAFLARLNVEPAQLGQEIRPLMLAGTFAILYVVSGLLAMTAAFSSYNPWTWRARKAKRALRRAHDAELTARSGWESAAAEHQFRANEIERADGRLTTELALVEADDAVAEEYAKVAILRRLDAVDGL